MSIDKLKPPDAKPEEVTENLVDKLATAQVSETLSISTGDAQGLLGEVVSVQQGSLRIRPIARSALEGCEVEARYQGPNIPQGCIAFTVFKGSNVVQETSISDPLRKVSFPHRPLNKKRMLDL